MNNKVKQVLVLLFVVSTLLIMIGSVSANTDNLNENLEASNTLNEDLSVVSDADNDVSNQLAISNIDEKTNGSSQGLGESNSENVVSNYKDTTIDAKDSDKNIIKASNDGNDVLSDGPNFVITNKALDPLVNVGDYVGFEIFVRNTGSTYTDQVINLDVFFNSNELEFFGRQPGINPEAFWMDFSSNHLDPIIAGDGHVVLRYDCGRDFQYNHIFNVTAIFKTKTAGILETRASIDQYSNLAKAQTVAGPTFVITNRASKSVVNVGDEVDFEVVVRNIGTSYSDGWKFIGVDFNFNPDEFEYVRYTPCVNPDNGADLRGDFLNPREYDNGNGITQYAYNYENYGGFHNNYCFKFLVTLKVKSYGTLETTAKLTELSDTLKGVSASASTSLAPDLVITNTALNPISAKGDDVAFEISVKNNGGTYHPDPIAGMYFVGVNLYKITEELSYQNVICNPDLFLNPLNPDSGFAQFGYKVGDEGFRHDDSFKFTVIYKVLSDGTLGVNSQLTQFDSVTSYNTTTTKDPEFVITNTALNPYVNIGDTVSFEVSVKNIGGTFNSDLMGIGFDYDSNNLEYLSFNPNTNTDNFNIGGNPNPNFGMNDNGMVIGYIPADHKFRNGDDLKFTLSFKVKGHGTFNTKAFMWHAWGISSQANVVSKDPNFAVTDTPSSKTMKVGDNVAFNYFVQNQGSKYNDNYVGIDIYFDSDKLEYLNFTEIPNLKLESIEYKSSQGSGNPVLGAYDGDVLFADSTVGHLKLGYTSDNGFDGGSNFAFDVNFKALSDGKLQNSAQVTWDQSRYTSRAFGVAYAGDPSFKLTKTADNEFLNMNDDVSYEVYLENNGTLQYIETDVIQIDDWYPEALIYTGYTINPGKDGVTPVLTIDDTERGHIAIKYRITDDGWAPGSSLNITLHFKVNKKGIICNFVFSHWNSSDVSSVVVEEPEMFLNKTCRNSSVELNDEVYYDIYVENTGNISYFDHEHAWGEQFLIIEDLYPEGLEYTGYILNPDKNGDRWDDNYAFVGPDGDHRILIKYKTFEGWLPGSSLNITLKFKAVKYGKLVNDAHIFWHWKDWGTKESQKDIDLKDEAVTIVGPATFSIDKISNFKVANVGDIVSFSIVYTNTGNKTISGAYIKDNSYSQGLEYYDYSDKDLWTFLKDENTWYYNGELEAGQSVTLKLFFKALTVGEKFNTASGGFSGSDDELNDTDSVLIKEKVNGTADTEEQKFTPEEPEEEEDNVSVNEPGQTFPAENTIPATGNPLIALLISLLTLCFVERKGKK